MRQSRYQFTKEFLADLNQTPAMMQSLQLVEGFRALGGAYWRPVAEIRHILELSQQYPGIIRIHKRADLNAVKFNVELGCFEWYGIFKYNCVRSLIEITSAVTYFVLMFMSLFILMELSQSNLTMQDYEFWFALIFPGFYLGIVAFTAFIYVLKVDQSMLLIQKSKEEIPGEWRIMKVWRKLRNLVGHFQRLILRLSFKC